MGFDQHGYQWHLSCHLPLIISVRVTVRAHQEWSSFWSFLSVWGCRRVSPPHRRPFQNSTTLDPWICTSPFAWASASIWSSGTTLTRYDKSSSDPRLLPWGPSTWGGALTLRAAVDVAYTQGGRPCQISVQWGCTPRRPPSQTFLVLPESALVVSKYFPFLKR